jgi:hypothetical protein
VEQQLALQVAVRTFTKLCLALVAVVIMYKVAWHRGELTGSMGVNYWQGWQDAMMQTAYGTRPFDSEQKPLE